MVHTKSYLALMSSRTDKLSVGTKQGISDERQLLLPGSEGRTHAMKLKHDAHLFASVLVLAAGALLIGGLVAESAQSRVLTFLGFEVAIGVYCKLSFRTSFGRRISRSHTHQQTSRRSSIGEFALSPRG